MKQTIHSVGSDFGQSTKRLLPSKQLMVLMVFMLTIIVDKHTKDSQWELEINVAAIWSKTKTIKPTGDLI